MLTLVRDDGLHPMLAIELARRGRVWGKHNADVLAAMRAGTAPPRDHGGPGYSGRHAFLISVSGDRRYAFTSGYRRLAAPAP
jgi:hypothetical protein